MQVITKPEQVKVIPIAENHARVEVLGCYPGYGPTLGNALRRVLLSSLEGAAIHSVKIKGVAHEFSTIEGVMEDVVQIILNLKQIRFRTHSDENIVVTIKKKGEGPVTAGDIKLSSGIEVVNPEQVIATITDKKVELEMEIEVDRGLGYVPVENRQRDEKQIGVIAIDSVYSPVKRVNYDVENMRVGKRTDYDKVTLEIITDGSITPEVAFTTATEILVAQFSALTGGVTLEEAV
jgi:DNA-directed RNA polymerase subunit alpha